MMFSLFLSRVLGILRDTALAAVFGLAHEADAYRLSFQIPDLLFFLIAGGALSSAFIPVFSEYLHTDREEDAWKVFSVVVTVMSIIVVAFIVFAWIFAYPLTYIIAPSAEKDAIRPLIATLSRIVLPAQYAFFIGGLMFGTLYARQKFTVPGLGPNIYNLGIIFGALFLSSFFHPGIMGMSWGALIGACVGNLLIPYLAMRKIGIRFKPSLDVKHPGVKKVFVLMLPVVLGLSLPGVYSMIMQAFASYYPYGTNASIDLSNKLMQAPLGIFGQSLAIAVFPALTQFYAQRRMDHYRNQLSSTMRTVVFITMPISVLMFVMAPEIVTVFFAYGKSASKSGASVQMVTESLRFFALGISAWCLHPVLMRAFFAIQKSLLPVVLGTVTTFAFVVLLLVFRLLPIGYLGLPLAGSLSAVFLIVLMLVFVGPQIGGFDAKGLGVTLAKSALCAAAFGLVLWIGKELIPYNREVALFGKSLGKYSINFWSMVKVLGPGLVGAWVYFFAARALKMPETAYFDRVAAKFAKRKAAEV